MTLPTYAEALSKALQTASNAEPIVGGLALTIWARGLGLDQARNFPATATRDLDFVATRTFARDFEHRLRAAGLAVGSIYADMVDDAGSPNVAVLTVPVSDDDKPFTIDVLESIPGLSRAEIRKRSTVLLYDDSPVKVIHPCDLALSRAYNILRLPARRDPRDFDQLTLGVAILRVWMTRRLQGKSAEAQREVLDVAKRLYLFSRHRDGMTAYLDYGIDLMPAIPFGSMPKAYQHEAYPRASADLKARRDRRVADLARRRAYRAAAVTRHRKRP